MTCCTEGEDSTAIVTTVSDVATELIFTLWLLMDCTAEINRKVESCCVEDFSDSTEREDFTDTAFACA
jgi:hypothetical protein